MEKKLIIKLTPDQCNAENVKAKGYDWFKEYVKNLPERFEKVKDSKKLYEQITGDKVKLPSKDKENINDKIQ